MKASMQRLQWQTRKLPVPQRGLKSPEHRIARADPALPNEHVDDLVMIGMQGGTCLDVGPARGHGVPGQHTLRRFGDLSAGGCPQRCRDAGAIGITRTAAGKLASTEPV